MTQSKWEFADLADSNQMCLHYKWVLFWLGAALCTPYSAENELRVTNALKIPVKEIIHKLPSNFTKHAEQSCSKDPNKRECDIHPNTMCYKRNEEQLLGSRFTAATALAW